jgi:pimeloyl-ACP methyl ester carboxylesterase
MLREGGHVGQPNQEGRATPSLLTHGFWRSGQQLLLLDGEIAIDCPVRLVHGEADREVPLEVAFRTLRAIRSADVQLNVIKGAGHRLSEPHEIDAILRTVTALLEPAP